MVNKETPEEHIDDDEILNAEDIMSEETDGETEMSPEEKIAKLEAAVEEANAQVLYVKAEGENVRRRATEEVDKARKFALEKFSGELLAVKDSLDAALAVEEATVESYKDGVELTAKQLLTVFEKFDITEVNPIAETFDPNKHQAVGTVDSDLAPNTVVNVLQKGYTLNDRVLRPALVMVSKVA